MRAPLFAVIMIATMAALAACGGSDNRGPSSTPTTTEGSDTPSVVIRLSAVDNIFSRTTITVDAGALIAIEFSSEDGAPHNFAVYTNTNAEEEVYVGDTFTGPDESQTEEFLAPEEPGDYFFRCDVHPDTMTGTLVVE